ncbi:unnamed protein product [Mucor hiemalis]
MPAYHSQFNDGDYQSIGNMFLLPVKTKFRGNAPYADGTGEDVIDESLDLFRANCLFRNFEIKGNADRSTPQGEALKSLNTLAVSNFAIPSDPSFPLNAMYQGPTDKYQSEQMKQYMQQLRQELVVRLVDRIYIDGHPSKWWMCFSKRKFMNLSL